MNILRQKSKGFSSSFPGEVVAAIYCTLIVAHSDIFLLLSTLLLLLRFYVSAKAAVAVDAAAGPYMRC